VTPRPTLRWSENRREIGTVGLVIAMNNEVEHAD
jgi:hypothetical protein